MGFVLTGFAAKIQYGTPEAGMSGIYTGNHQRKEYGAKQRGFIEFGAAG